MASQRPLRGSVAKLSAEERIVLEHVSKALGTRPEWLEALIQFESGWRPAAKNPGSSARGLIQFMDATAKQLGYASSQALIDACPTRLDQLSGPVVRYLIRYAPLDSFQKLCMAVFYPAARKWPLDDEFPPEVQAANPGIKTVRDYINYVWNRVGESGPAPE